MTGIKKPKYSKAEVSQKFNLKKILGYSPSERQKELFFDLAVDKMVQRTAQGLDIEGSKFAEYTDTYAEKKGVIKTSVDLIGSGDMLLSNVKEGKQKNILKIKVKEGVETLKSFNHNTGDSKGMPTRNYFGFKNEKQLSDVISQVDSIKEEKKSLLSGIADIAALRKLVDETIDIDLEDF